MPHSWFVDGFIGPRIVSRPRARSQRFGGGKERGRGFRVFVALEEPKEPDAIVVELVVRAVLDRGDSSDRASVAQREKELAVGGAIERIVLRIQRIANGDAQRRHPLRVVASIIDLPREIYEPAQLAR